MVHNRDPTKNCENTLIECTPKTMFKASFSLKNWPDPLSIPQRLLLKYKKPSYVVSIFFMLLKILPFLHLLLSRVYNLHKVETTNKNYWCFFKMPLPTHVIFLKVLF